MACMGDVGREQCIVVERQTASRARARSITFAAPHSRQRCVLALWQRTCR